MKNYIIPIALLMITPLSAQVGKATTVRKTFSRETTITEDIEAQPEQIWKVLVDAANYPKWNSTIVSIEGTIALNEKIKLVSTLDEKRTFKLKVKEFIPHRKLVWGDGKGERTFLMEPLSEDKVRFTMHEKIGGLLFPMYAKYIPPFDQNFEQFVEDLKSKVEER
ncbi:MAG: SRPBCC domain-containing protein [Bacteroidota bacterium]